MKGGSFNSVLHNIELLGALKKKYGTIEVSHFILDFDGTIDIEEQPQVIKDVIDYYEIWKPHNFGNGRTYREIGNIQKISCGRPQSGPMQINWSGIVVPCCYDYNESIVLGDASKQTLEEILKSEIYESLRESHVKNEYTKFPYCDNCDQLLCNKKENSIIYTTNPIHKGLTKEDIVTRTNTSPEVPLI